MIVQVLSNVFKFPFLSKATKGSSGYDLNIGIPHTYCYTMKPKEIKVFPTGITLRLAYGYEGQIISRPSLALFCGIVVLNQSATVGRGTLHIELINMTSNPITLYHGDFVAQIIFQQVAAPIFVNKYQTISFQRKQNTEFE